MNFRSVAQMSDQILGWSRELPTDLDVVVGIPRSGLLAANLLALYRNLPFTDFEGLLEGRYFTGGARLDTAGADERWSPKRLLVVDDSVNTGKTIQAYRERARMANLDATIEFAAVYVQPHRTHLVDHYCEVLNQPRVFEWNVLHHPRLANFCLDLDGVLCFDPVAHQNDDGEEYRRFIDDAAPLLRPKSKVGWIVTSRLEKYREPTVRWLRKWNIDYGQLVMLDYPDAVTRRSLLARTAYKADVYRRTRAELFIESSLQQSFEIANLSRRDVLCTDAMQLVRPGSFPLSRPYLRTDDMHPPKWTRRAVRRWVPASVRAKLLRLGT
jgi:orotate phosphoribosyltransferase